MKKKIANIARMLRTTGTVLNQNQEKWATLAVMATTVPEFLKMVEKIDPAMLASEKDVTAPTVSKNDCRDELEEEVFLMASALQSIGNFEKDTDMVQATAFSESSLSRLMEDKLTTTAETVLAFAKKNGTKLADYGIAAADITKLEELTKQFSTLQTAPRSKLVDRKAAKESLVEVVDAAKKMLLDQIDLQMELMRRREPEFYSAYQSARKIVDTGIRHAKKVTKTVEDENQGKPTI